MDPQWQRLRYQVEGNVGRKRGVENSLAAWKNVAWFADNGGSIVALDLDRFVPLWAWFGEGADDTNGSIAVEVIDGRPALFVGSEIEYQHTRTQRCWLHRFDGLNGEQVWTRSFDAMPAEDIAADSGGGIFSSVLLGQEQLSDRLFVTVSQVGGAFNGLLLAIDKETGENIWEWEMPFYAWSSPTVVYDEEGAGRVIIGDVKGGLHLLDGATGELLHSQELGYVIEASPAVWGDTFVLPMRGPEVHAFRVE